VQVFIHQISFEGSDTLAKHEIDKCGKARAMASAVRVASLSKIPPPDDDNQCDKQN
jgi:hypothetical protein